MKSFFTYLFFAIVFILIGWFANVAWHLPKDSGSPIAAVKQYPLEKYSFDNLGLLNVESSKIELGQILKDAPKFTSYQFFITFDPTFTNSTKKRVSGQINIPKENSKNAAVVMFRGFVDQTIYKTGMGTLRASEYFAENGYITVAPDFLGYAASDKEAGDIFESRFQTYTTALATLKSLENSKTELVVNDDKVYLWGHSNGGQIAVAVLEITKKPYKTILWAPNSAKFPYSILYYLDEASDQGKLIITELSKLMTDYDVTKYSIRSFLDQIHPQTKIQIHQGTGDEAVPYGWNDSLVKKLKDQKIDVTYFKYTGADHNLNPSWSSAVQTSLEFLNSQ